MNNMKRFAAVLLVLSILLCFAACGEDQPATTTEAPVATTTTPVPPTTLAPPTTATQTPEYTYRVKVVDENGVPVEGITVQLCTDSCSFANTDAEGWAYFKNKTSDGAKARVLIAAGYTFADEDIYLEAGSNELTLVITKAA